MEKPFIILKTYSFTHEAEMELNRLKDEKIDAYLTDTNMGSFSFLGAATGGVKLHVSEKDAKRAKSILSEESVE